MHNGIYKNILHSGNFLQCFILNSSGRQFYTETPIGKVHFNPETLGNLIES